MELTNEMTGWTSKRDGIEPPTSPAWWYRLWFFKFFGDVYKSLNVIAGII